MSERTRYRRRAELGLTRKLNRNTFNESFFEQWSPELAWLLGVIWSDGYLVKNTIDLSSKDSQMIELVQGIIGLKTGVYIKNNGGALCVRFTSKRIAERLRALGLHQRKSFTITWPTVPPELEGDFFRGLLDGDGCIRLNMTRPGQQAPDLRVDLMSASPDLLDGATSWLQRHDIRHSRRQASSSCERIQIFEQASLRRLYPLIYTAGEATICLTRKHGPYFHWMHTPRARCGRPRKD